jgi:hypothetical protein
MAVKWRIAPTVGSLAHYSPFSLMQQVCFRPLFLCLPKESRQDNCPLLRQKSGKSNKKSTVVWYFYSPIQGVSLFHHSLTFHGIVFPSCHTTPRLGQNKSLGLRSVLVRANAWDQCLKNIGQVSRWRSVFNYFSRSQCTTYQK